MSPPIECATTTAPASPNAVDCIIWAKRSADAAIA
jgi:hypothetical protein